MPIRAVFFDVGGTLVDETRMFREWAEWLHVPELEFLAALGATVALGQPHRKVFEMVAPEIDIPKAAEARRAAGRAFTIEPRDLYDDAASCIRDCRSAGYVVGIAGNQPESAEAALLACQLGADHLAVSAKWGVAKPDPRFFTLVCQACNLPPEEIAYVGDRVDNDVVPAAAAGLKPVFLTRGPWGIVHATWPGATQAAATIRTLADLPAILATL